MGMADCVVREAGCTLNGYSHEGATMPAEQKEISYAEESPFPPPSAMASCEENGSSKSASVSGAGGGNEQKLEQNLVRWRSIPALPTWQTVESGRAGTLTYRARIFDRRTCKEVSPWHGIPLHCRGITVNFVCKTPKQSGYIFESAKDEDKNPLKLSKQPGKPAFYTYNSEWNLGMLPQTYPDPHEPNLEMNGLQHDGLPLEALEIGSRTARTGEVYAVKPLAVYLVIEDGTHLSWKIVSIAADDPLAEKLNNAADVGEHMPELFPELRQWLRTCKWHSPETADSEIGLDGNVGDCQLAKTVIARAHRAWQQMYGSLNGPHALLRGPMSGPVTRSPSLGAFQTSSSVNLSGGGHLSFHGSGLLKPLMESQPSFEIDLEDVGADLNEKATSPTTLPLDSDPSDPMAGQPDKQSNRKQSKQRAWKGLLKMLHALGRAGREAGQQQSPRGSPTGGQKSAQQVEQAQVPALPQQSKIQAEAAEGEVAKAGPETVLCTELGASADCEPVTPPKEGNNPPGTASLASGPQRALLQESPHHDKPPAGLAAGRQPSLGKSGRRRRSRRSSAAGSTELHLPEWSLTSEQGGDVDPGEGGKALVASSSEQERPGVKATETLQKAEMRGNASEGMVEEAQKRDARRLAEGRSGSRSGLGSIGRSGSGMLELMGLGKGREASSAKESSVHRARVGPAPKQQQQQQGAQSSAGDARARSAAKLTEEGRGAGQEGTPLLARARSTGAAELAEDSLGAAEALERAAARLPRRRGPGSGLQPAGVHESSPGLEAGARQERGQVAARQAFFGGGRIAASGPMMPVSRPSSGSLGRWGSQARAAGSLERPSTSTQPSRSPSPSMEGGRPERSQSGSLDPVQSILKRGTGEPSRFRGSQGFLAAKEAQQSHEATESSHRRASLENYIARVKALKAKKSHQVIDVRLPNHTIDVAECVEVETDASMQVARVVRPPLGSRKDLEGRAGALRDAFRGGGAAGVPPVSSAQRLAGPRRGEQAQDEHSSDHPDWSKHGPREHRSEETSSVGEQPYGERGGPTSATKVREQSRQGQLERGLSDSRHYAQREDVPKWDLETIPTAVVLKQPSTREDSRLELEETLGALDGQLKTTPMGLKIGSQASFKTTPVQVAGRV